MRTNTTLFSLLLSSGLLFLGCTNKPSSPQEPISETTFPITLSFETGIGTEQTVTLSQIAREVKIIPLETTDQCLLPAIIKNSITLCGHNLYIPTQKQVFQFTDEGKFVRTVARMGQYRRIYRYSFYINRRCFQTSIPDGPWKTTGIFRQRRVHE